MCLMCDSGTSIMASSRRMSNDHNGTNQSTSNKCIFDPGQVLNGERTTWTILGPTIGLALVSFTFTVHCCFLFPVPCSLFPVHCCSLFTVHCSLFTVHCSLFTVYCSLFTVHCSLFTVPCSLFTVHCSLFTVHCFVHCFVHCTRIPRYT
jgi:hypothetical protein